MSTQVVRRRWTFDTRPDDDPTWSHATTGDATVERVADRWELSLTATNEAQQARVDFGGNLAFDVTKLRIVKFLIDLGTIPEGVSAYFGLALANQSSIDSIATRVLFQALGTNEISLRVDDGVIDSGNVSTGWTAAGKMEFQIDLANGVEAVFPVHLSKTGKNALQFFHANEGRELVKLNRAGLGLSNFILSLQPFIRIEKASGTATAKIKLFQFESEHLS